MVIKVRLIDRKKYSYIVSLINELDVVRGGATGSVTPLILAASGHPWMLFTKDYSFRNGNQDRYYLIHGSSICLSLRNNL